MKVLVATILAFVCAASAPRAEENPATDLAQRMIESRAVEAVIWGMPAVNTELMRQEMLTKTAGKENQIIYWGRPLDWHNQTLTPNPDSIYFMAFYDTKNGTIVFEIPPSNNPASDTGNIVTVWQTAIEDVGLLGVDKGAGGKFAVVPPGWKDALPDGFTKLQSDTLTGYALIRSSFKSHSEADIANAVAHGKTLKLYPLSAAANPPATIFTDVQDANYDSTIRYDDSFFTNLDRVIQRENWIERDRAMIDQLRAIGIERGKPFAPDDATKAILNSAIEEARAVLEQRYDAGFPPFYPASHWTMPTLQEAMEGQGTTYAAPDHYALDARALLYTYGYISIKRPGTAQFYLISIRDKDGNAYDGANTYRLRVPANPPVDQYWSVTAYDRETHALIKNMPRASRSSQIAEMQKNTDGSIDVYFGAQPPEGRETNWVPTDPARKFELMFRLYGPKPDFFQKHWTLPDVERLGQVASSETAAQHVVSPPVPVTIDNFARAESDMYLSNLVKESGGVGKLLHHREPASIDNQTVIRLNRDTLYSFLVLDLDAGPATITMPDPGTRFMSLQIINEDHYVPAVNYGAGTYTLTREAVGTRYAVAGIRTLVNPNDRKDVEQVHALQDAIKVSQGGRGQLDIPNWDKSDQAKIRNALLDLAQFSGGFKNAFGTKETVDPVRHLIGTAAGWGGNPDKDATYLSFSPKGNDGKTIYTLLVGDVPVDAFWSVSVYNAQGYFEKNDLGAYTLNSITAQKSGDGAVRIRFGGCDGKVENCLPTMPGWNYTVRLYRPHAEILNGSWKFPEPQIVVPTSAEGASSGEGR